MRVRLRREDATLSHVRSHSGHHGPHVLQHVEEVTRPEPMEGGLRREDAANSHVRSRGAYVQLLVEVEARQE